MNSSRLLVVMTLMALGQLSAAEPRPKTAPVAPAASAEAKEILETAGVKGGLVVHYGCTDGELTAALRTGDGCLVHGLARDAASAENARRHIRSLGLYGKVSVEIRSGNRLPYVDNLVNLFVAEDLHGVSMDEVLRVVAPGGAACIRREGKWTKTVKPRSAIDDWTHALYDASNNAVSKDAVVGPPHHLQWVAEPRNARHHEALASVSVAVSAGGRLFSIVDEAPAASILLPAEWRLVARDAFNGVLLWKRPIANWEPHLRGFRSGPSNLARRLVAYGDRVFLTLGLDAPVTVLDAATGRTIATCQGTEGTEEILFRDGVLFLVAGRTTDEKGATRAWPQSKIVMAVDAASNRVLWKRTAVQPLPMSLAASVDRVFWLAPDAVVCVDAKTGADAWRAERKVARQRPDWSTPTLVVQGDVVLCADRRPTPVPDVDESTGKPMAHWLAEGGGAGDLVAYSARTGQPLWNAKCGESYHAPIDVFVHGGLVWLGRSRARHGPDYTAALDLLTGEVKRRISPEQAFATTMPHHRCYRDRATARYLVTGRTGVELIDIQTGEAFRHHWVRGVCQYGVVPANGLLYAPPHSCACYIEAKLTGFNALAPASESSESRVESPESRARGHLECGPAFRSALDSQLSTLDSAPSTLPIGPPTVTIRAAAAARRRPFPRSSSAPGRRFWADV